ncbi:MAG: histidine phosphotransferase family protein, partial [Gemmobacter sp.]|nr:histidine phosphotransferase family protein [Gemmobacter sp.]
RREGAQWHVSAQGRRLKVEPELWALVSDPAASAGGLTAPQVQFGLLRRDLMAGPGLARVAVSDSALDLVWGAGTA